MIDFLFSVENLLISLAGSAAAILWVQGPAWLAKRKQDKQKLEEIERLNELNKSVGE